VTERDRTLAAIARRRLEVVLLARRAKYPDGASWQITRDPRVVADHLDRGGNLGIVAGPHNGCAILDPDDLAGWSDMVDALGQPGAPWVETGSGRLHYYVTWTVGLPAKLRWSGRIIGEIQRGPTVTQGHERQQVVAPPSVHPVTGRPYRWLVDPVTAPLGELPSVWRHALAPVVAPALPSRDRDAAGLEDRHALALAQPGARRRAGGDVKFRCPGCAADGHDRHQDNARLFARGGWGCAVAPKGSPDGRRHWTAIGIALGALGPDGRRRSATG